MVNKKLSKEEKAILEAEIKREICMAQSTIDSNLKKIRAMDTSGEQYLFPLFNRKVQHLTSYIESLENINY